MPKVMCNTQDLAGHFERSEWGMIEAQLHEAEKVEDGKVAHPLAVARAVASPGRKSRPGGWLPGAQTAASAAAPPVTTTRFLQQPITNKFYLH